MEGGPILEPSEMHNEFIKIYNDTYNDVLKYVVAKCNDANDIKDLMQNIYLSFFKSLNKNSFIKNNKKYLITIAKHELFKYYGILKSARSMIPVFSEIDDEDYTYLERDMGIKDMACDSLICSEIWEYIKTFDLLTFKIFVLYFNHDMKIIDISKTLKTNESMVKNRLYRTLKKIREEFKY